MVLVHGAMDRSAGFLRVARRLDGVEWVAPDRRGYGRSVDPTRTAATFDEHVADLTSLLATLPPRPTVLVGHSLGATISAASAARSTDLVDALVLFEAPLPWMAWWPITDPDGRRIEDDPPGIAVDRFMERVVGREAWERVPEPSRVRRRSEGPTMIAELVTARSRPAFDRSDLTMPTIVARGSRCDGARERAFDWLVDGIPDARARIIDDAPHIAHSTHPDEFAELIGEAISAMGTEETTHGATAPTGQ